MLSDELTMEITNWITERYPEMRGKERIIKEIAERVEFEMTNSLLAVKYNTLEKEYV